VNRIVIYKTDVRALAISVRFRGKADITQTLDANKWRPESKGSSGSKFCQQG
jgi:hypothetical protein